MLLMLSLFAVAIVMSTRVFSRLLPFDSLIAVGVVSLIVVALLQANRLG
jgi:hypothetical protein